jgi:hypothetical protein
MKEDGRIPYLWSLEPNEPFDLAVRQAINGMIQARRSRLTYLGTCSDILDSDMQEI